MVKTKSRSTRMDTARNRNVPLHLAIIPDGNRRFANERGISKAQAHALGADKIESLMDWCLDSGIKYLTAYAFSSQNFKRPELEKKALMHIYHDKFRKIASDERIHDEEVRVRAIGKRRAFPEYVREAIETAEKATEDYDRFHLTVAIGYGGRSEIVEATRRLVKLVSDGKMSSGEIDEKVMNSLMYAPDVPDPDLVVRTSGERRLSGFMLWHIPETKLHFSEKYWPEFEKGDLIEAIEDWRRNSEND